MEEEEEFLSVRIPLKVWEKSPVLKRRSLRIIRLGSLGPSFPSSEEETSVSEVSWDTLNRVAEE